MKKVALSLLALAVVAVGAFADAPKWDPKVSTDFKGEATVTLGYDVDTGISAFKNGTSVSLIVDLVSGGDRTSASDKDVWGEIKIKTDGDPYRIKADGVASDGKATYEPGFKLQVDYAKIHFGKAAYLSVTAHDTKLGYVNSPDLAFVGHWFDHAYGTSGGTTVQTIVTGAGDEKAATGVSYTTLTGVAAAVPLTKGTLYVKTVVTAAAATGTRYGKDEGALAAVAAADAKNASTANPAAASVGAANAGGIEFGYTLDKVASLTIDVGSTDAWAVTLVDAGAKTQIAYAAKVGILLVDNLTAEAGYSAQTLADSGAVIGGKLAYKYQIDGDKLYVKPLVGVANITPAGKDAKAYQTAVASLLIGTGAKAAQFDNFGLKLDNDYGAYPGVSAGVFFDNKTNVTDGNVKPHLGLNVSANSGALIADTTVVVAYDVADLNATDVISAITVGASTSFKAGDVTIAPKGFVVSQNAKNGFATKDTDVATKKTDSALFAKVAADVTGVIPFVTFTVNYESNDLSNGYITAREGKLVADKMGKLELTTKISF